jgi:hypothetical protein
MAARAPEGAIAFRPRHLDARHLEAGDYRLEIVLERRGETLGRRTLGTTRIVHPLEPGVLSLVLLGLGLVGVVFSSGRAGVLFVLAVSLAQGLFLATLARSPTPLSAAFPETRTTRLLQEEQGFTRVLGGPGVLPYDTGLAHGLFVLDGYDALDVAAFDAFRPFAQRAGAHPILDWNAAGVDLDSPAFRLLGAHWLAVAAPLTHAGWELVAGPTPEAPRAAEVFVYRALDPLPRAFVVSELIERESVLADPSGFDPRAAAFLEPGVHLSFATPCQAAEVRVDGVQAGRVELHAELDGDGLLVLGEQNFPGWGVEVDGEARPLLTVNSLFRGVSLAAGEHEIVFRYRPPRFRQGCVLAALALLGLACAVAFGGTRSSRAP